MWLATISNISLAAFSGGLLVNDEHEKGESMFNRRQRQLRTEKYFYYKNLILMSFISSSYFT